MEWLESFTSNNIILTYAIVFIATILEGDVSLLFFGALSRGNFLPIPQLIIVSFVAAFCHDLIFWLIGKKMSAISKKKFLCFDMEKITQFVDKISYSFGPLIVVSKFVWNFNRAILVSAGYSKMKFKSFILYSLPADALWAITFSSIGYVFADQTNIFKQKIEYIGLILIALVVGVILFQLYFKSLLLKYLQNAKDYISSMNGGLDKKD